MTMNIDDRIYYTGDMVNMPDEGVIFAIRPANRWGGESYDIRLDDGRVFLGIFPAMFGRQPGRRFWLLSEWKADRDKRIAEMQAERIRAHLA